MTTHRVHTPHRAAWITLTVAALLMTPLRPVGAAADPAIDAQQFVYELNRARWNPALFEIESGVVLPPVPAAPPVAIQGQLESSARLKADEMADNTYFGHQSAVTGKWPNQLAREAGFPLPSGWPSAQNYLESIHSGNTDPFRVVAAFAMSPSHRVHVFGEGGFSTYTEIGVGRSHTASYWAVHLAQRATPLRTVTGVVFADADGDGRMDPGEGLSGVTVTMGRLATVTNSGGGYALALPSGPATVTATVDGLKIEGAIVPAGYSIGVDFVAGDPRAIVRAYELCEGRAPTIMGTDRDDEISGTPGDDVIHGLGGNDVIHGLGGDDIICGGTGSDTLKGGGGADRLVGGTGNDRLVGGGGADTVRGEAGDDRLEGGTGADSLTGDSGADTLVGGSGDDTLTGGPQTDRADGAVGTDTCAEAETRVNCER